MFQRPSSQKREERDDLEARDGPNVGQVLGGMFIHASWDPRHPDKSHGQFYNSL